MKAICWRLDEHQAVIYTEDRDVVRRLVEVEPFAGRKEASFSTYLDRSGKAFAWQAVFASGLWSRVVGYLRRNEVAVEDRTPREPRATATAPRGSGRSGARSAPSSSS